MLSLCLFKLFQQSMLYKDDGLQKTKQKNLEEQDNDDLLEVEVDRQSENIKLLEKIPTSKAITLEHNPIGSLSYYRYPIILRAEVVILAAIQS